MHKHIAALLIALIGYCAPARAQAPSAERPDFRPLVREAIATMARRVVIPPGVYRLAPEAGHGIVWEIARAQDLEIVADGVTLVCTRLTRAIQIESCRNLTLRGLTIDYDPLPFTQGTVAAVAPDKSWVDIKIHDGYPRKPLSRIDVVDPKTRFRKRGMPFLWGTRAVMQAPDTVRVSLKGIGSTASAGDLASLSGGAEAGGVVHGVTIERCAETTLRHVTLHCAPGMGILEADGEGGAKYLGCRIVPGPKPRGATEERLLTTSWDAMQSKAIRRGPLVENCVIQDAGDDSWSVQSSDYLVVKREGRIVTLASRDEWTDGVQVGDRLRAGNGLPEAVIVERRVARRDKAGLDAEVLKKLEAAAPWSAWSASPKCFEVTLDREPPFALGDAVLCPERQGNGFTFRRNRLRSSGRLLIKASGLVEGNFLDQAHSLVVCPEVPNTGAAGIEGLTIRNNTIRGTGYFCHAPWSSQAGALSVTASMSPSKLRPPGVFRSLVIEDNIFTDVNGPSLVVSSASGVTIKGNRFMSSKQPASNPTGSAYGIAPGSTIWMAQCEGVTFEANTLAGASAKEAVVLLPSVTKISGAEAGIRVRK